jgi:hypothetical protein
LAKQKLNAHIAIPRFSAGPASHEAVQLIEGNLEVLSGLQALFDKALRIGLVAPPEGVDKPY